LQVEQVRYSVIVQTCPSAAEDKLGLPVCRAALHGPTAQAQLVLDSHGHPLVKVAVNVTPTRCSKLGWNVAGAYSVVDVKDPAPMIDDTVAVVNVLSSEDVASFVALVYDPFAACSTFGGLAPRQAFSFWEVDVWVFGYVVVNVMVVCVHAKAWLTCAPSYRCAHIVGIVGVVGKHVGREGYGSNEK